MTLRIISDNKADTATLSAAPALAATLPESNLQDPTRARVARSTSTADQAIKGTWSAAVPLTACALLRHNLTNQATWRLQLYSDAAWTTQVYDSGAQRAVESKEFGELDWGIDPLGAGVFTGWPVSFSTLYFPVVSARSFKLTLSDSTNPDGYLEASRLFIGRHFQPRHQALYPLVMSWHENTKQYRTDGGSLRSDPTENWRAMELDLGAVDPADRADLMEIFRGIGRRKDVFISVFPGVGGTMERDHTMQAKLVQDGSISFPMPALYSTKLRLEEV